ncbi:MAG TPA: alpha/beta hydrolase [Actinoplanes sp.]|jgi:pimeloyl-ACP methyl ester carboxylesterase
MTIIAPNWDLLHSGPADAEHTVLLIPGSLATAVFYAEVMAEPSLRDVRLVAATLPGQGGTQPAGEPSIENYARLTGELAADLGAQVLVGHSTGGSVVLEAAASGAFSGPLVLLAASLSRRDEPLAPRILDRLSTVFGHLPYAVALRFIGSMLGGGVPADRLDALVAELRKNDPRLVRRHNRLYLKYLDRHGSTAWRLCESGVRAWVVYGEQDEVGITDTERTILDDCPSTTVQTIAGTGHLIPNTRPDVVANLITQALHEHPRQPRTQRFTGG